MEFEKFKMLMEMFTSLGDGAQTAFVFWLLKGVLADVLIFIVLVWGGKGAYRLIKLGLEE